MAITVNVSAKAKKDIDDLDASIQPDVDAKIESLRRNWPDVAKKPLTGPWRGHFRIQVRKDWRIIVKPEHSELTVVRVFHRSGRGYDEGGRDVSRDFDDKHVVVTKAFVREAMRGKPTRNFASEYIRWSLGQNLRAARKAGQLSQKDLAARIGKAQSTVSMAEKGQIRVSSAYVRAVLKACGVPKDWGARYWRERSR